MTEVEIIISDEVKCLKNEIKALQRDLNKPNVAKEELLTFDMLDRYRHIIQQQAWPWRWENVDALYTITDCILTWVVDDTIMAIWASGRQGLPNSFANWDSPKKEAGMALMLSQGPSCLGVGTDLEGEKVYSAVVVFVHPKQELLMIKEGAECLIATVKQSDSGSNSDVTVLCGLPSHKHGRFYPSVINHTYLVLPYLAKKGNPKKLRLDLAMCYNCHLVVCRLHRWEGKFGDLALLPPVFSRDPTAPILLPVGYIGELWLNNVFNTLVDAGSSGLGKLRPTISRLTCCRQEVIAGRTLVDWTEDEHVVYPPVTLAPKDGAADEPNNDPDNDPNNNPNNDPADKSEHDGESDENAMPKKTEDQESEDKSDDESKMPKAQTTVLRDSGLGTSSSGHGIGVGANNGAVVGNPSARLGTGIPLPTQLPSMEVLEQLADDLYAYSRELFRGLEEISMAMLDRILSGFKRSGGRTREYIHETAAISINFFSRAGDMEAELESSEALKFREAVNSMKESIRDLIRWTALAEESYEDAAAQFDNILSSVSDELKEFVESQGEEQCQEYISKCMERIRGVHGSLDGTQFIPMVVTNATTHHALALNQRVNQSQIPLQIMISPMCTQATTMGARLKFVEFLSRRVLALDVKLGPVTAVSLESGGEGAGVQSASGTGGGATPIVTSTPVPPENDSLKTLFTTHTPPTTDHTCGTPKAKTPDTPSKPKTMFSPKAAATLAKFKGMSDNDGSSRRRHGESASREVPAKRAKVDNDSDSYLSLTPSKSEPPKKTKKEKIKKKAPSSDEGSSSSDEERAAPRKPSKDDRADAIAWANRDRTSKWKKDLAHVDRYRQRKGLCAKELTGGPSNARHVDLLTQLLNERQLGLKVIHLDTHIEEVLEDSPTSKQARRLLKALQEVRGETMGRSSVYPEYVVKAFLAPQSQCVIQKGDNNHWDTSAMIGLYNLHKYEAVGKRNKTVDSKKVTKGYCPFCEYSAGNNGSINNHICVHYRLVLECSLTNCNVVMYDAERMVGHAKEKHKLETDA